MAIRALGGALRGVDAVPIEVEVDLLRRLPTVVVVGLAASAVKESSERIRSAVGAAGLDFPRKRVVVNLAPADLRKEGTAFDLPIALAILAADEQIPGEALDDLLIVGELSLSGELRPIRGALSMALLARREGKRLLLPRASAAEAALVRDVPVHGCDTLGDAVDWIRGEGALPRASAPEPTEVSGELDLADVRGQLLARRALEIAAAGAHHLMMVGPPGCGKTMLSQRLPTILPRLTFEEALESTQVHCAAGLDAKGCIHRRRPFRAPHHSVTVAGMVGSRYLRPGEVSLAHRGVLFLDEAPEFKRSVLEVLRQPLEDGVVQITRADGTVRFPARFSLVVAANPCPCGHRGSSLPCRCTDWDVSRYQQRISGPILDRLDLHVTLEAVTPQEILFGSPGESSSAVRARVEAARERQSARGQSGPNGQLGAGELEAFVRMTPESRSLLEQGARIHHLSGRGTTRVQKVARTIADLASAEVVAPPHVAEALAFRPHT